LLITESPLRFGFEAYTERFFFASTTTLDLR